MNKNCEFYGGTLSQGQVEKIWCYPFVEWKEVIHIQNIPQLASLTSGKNFYMVLSAFILDQASRNFQWWEESLPVEHQLPIAIIGSATKFSILKLVTTNWLVFPIGSKSHAAISSIYHFLPTVAFSSALRENERS